MALLPDITETFVIELRSFKSTTNARRGLVSGRYAVVLDGTEFHQDEYLIAQGTSKTLGNVGQVLLLRALSSGLTVTFTRTTTVTLKLVNLMVLSSDVTNVIINNTNGIGTDPVRVEAIWS